MQSLVVSVHLSTGESCPYPIMHWDRQKWAPLLPVERNTVSRGGYAPELEEFLVEF